jgi:hypothetical protein
MGFSLQCAFSMEHFFHIFNLERPFVQLFSKLFHNSSSIDHCEFAFFIFVVICRRRVSLTGASRAYDRCPSVRVMAPTDPTAPNVSIHSV